MRTEKIRLDEYLLKSGLIKEKSHIASYILSGSILVNDRTITKVGFLIQESDQVRIRKKIKEYVSRGAYKLLGAFDSFHNLSVADIVCLDIGASTGGFTQVLLEKGAKHVYAIDVGYGQLAQKLANDLRVTVIDRTHIKDLKTECIEMRTDALFFCMDLSFISLTQVFPCISRLYDDLLVEEVFGVALIKPQFEVPPNLLEKGIVRNRIIQLGTIRKVWRSVKKIDPRFKFTNLAESPIQGADGNHEFLLKWKISNPK